MRGNQKKESIKHTPKNRGSAIVEMTMLIPVYIGVIVLYINFFLYTIEYGFIMQGMLECLYKPETKSQILRERADVSTVRQGSTTIIRGMKTDRFYEINIELMGNEEDPADKIRRWQIAVGTVS